MLPPSIESLTERLNERGTNSKESIELRLSNAMKEIPSCKDYDHILVNDVFEDCCNDLARIITGEDSFPMNSKRIVFNQTIEFINIKTLKYASEVNYG